MKLAIIGSRTFNDYYVLDRTISQWFISCWEGGECSTAFDEVISGGARGADQLAAQWVKEWNSNDDHHRIKLTEHLPDWDRYGKRAGFLRNEDIVKGADMVLAFWDGVSRGTAHSLSVAKRLKRPTLIVYI